jgi:hypothetical protein
MKQLALRLLLALGLMTLAILFALIMPVNAQSDVRVAATVPFDFFVGDEKLQTGDYILRPYTMDLPSKTANPVIGKNYSMTSLSAFSS